MNKKELTRKLMKRMEEFGYFPTSTNVKIFIREYEKLTKSEPQKPVVSQFVADWYEENKDDFEGNLFRCVHNIPSTFDGAKLNEFERWFLNASIKAFQILVNMHQFGYEVEKEKRYEVILCNGQSLKTVYRQGEDRLDFEKVYGDLERFTRKQLEDAGFGWVFDCKGMEVREVKE